MRCNKCQIPMIEDIESFSWLCPRCHATLTKAEAVAGKTEPLLVSTLSIGVGNSISDKPVVTGVPCPRCGTALLEDSGVHRCFVCGFDVAILSRELKDDVSTLDPDLNSLNLGDKYHTVPINGAAPRNGYEGERNTVYGYCPKCGSKVVSRERRLNGNDTCIRGHIYPSSMTLPYPPTDLVSFNDLEDTEFGRLKKEVALLKQEVVMLKLELKDVWSRMNMIKEESYNPNIKG